MISLRLLLLILIVVVLLGGIGYSPIIDSSRSWGPTSGAGIVVVVLVLFLLFG